MFSFLLLLSLQNFCHCNSWFLTHFILFHSSLYQILCASLCFSHINLHFTSLKLLKTNAHFQPFLSFVLFPLCFFLALWLYFLLSKLIFPFLPLLSAVLLLPSLFHLMSFLSFPSIPYSPHHLLVVFVPSLPLLSPSWPTAPHSPPISLPFLLFLSISFLSLSLLYLLLCLLHLSSLLFFLQPSPSPCFHPSYFFPMSVTLLNWYACWS